MSGFLCSGFTSRPCNFTFHPGYCVGDLPPYVPPPLPLLGHLVSVLVLHPVPIHVFGMELKYS